MPRFGEGTQKALAFLPKKVYTNFMMKVRKSFSSGLVACTLAFSAAFELSAAEAEKPAEEAATTEVKVDEALRNEIAYVEALIDNGFPDFAGPVIAATKKKWPESEAQFFAIEIRGLLSLNKFDEAEKKIAALPDRNGAKFWAARLEVANNYFMRGRKADCEKIYNEFFKKFPKPTKELSTFHRQASYQYGQILVMAKDFEGACKIYEGLLANLNPKGSDEDDNIWCNVASETADMYLRLAAQAKDDNKRKQFLQGARKYIDKLLWKQDKPIFFGRAIAMKAHLELLGGRIDRAQGTIDDYMDQLAELHKSIKDADPDGHLGLLKLSPMPTCRYLLADMMWQEAESEFKKPKRDDNLIKDLMFGAKTKSGKRNGAGAYNHALNVFIQYPESTWAAPAGDLAEKIRLFAEKTYGAKIKTNITAEQMAKVRAMQFKAADDKFAERDYPAAIKEYYAALAANPECPEAIRAVENLASAYLDQIVRLKPNEKAKKEDLRIDADAVEGYLSERFADYKNKAMMTEAGNAVLRLAGKEKAYGDAARSVALYKAFMTNYRKHVQAPVTASAMAYEAQKAGKFREAIAFYNIIDQYYTNSTQYAFALSQLSACYEEEGDSKAALAALSKYVKVETSPLQSMQAQMKLAMMYQKDGLDIFKAAETNETPEAVEAQLKEGSAQIIRGIKQFMDFAKKADEKLADPAVSTDDKAKYRELKEAALYLVGDCWGRITKPADKLEAFRKRSAASLEQYVKQFPKGKYAKAAYVKLGTIYTALGDMAKSKTALDSLSREFPDSDEAKNAKPRLARSLIEMGLVQEGTEVYREMLNTDGAYTAGQFVDAGEALVNAKSWELANQAFEKAISKAGTNQVQVVAKARLGQAQSLYKQKAYAEARDALDTYLQDERMSRLAIAADANLLLAEVASEQGRTEKDDTLRGKHFGAAIAAIKKLRGYWRKKEQWEQDSVDLMSADIRVKRMNAEKEMGLDERAAETRELTAAGLKAFLQARRPTAEHPFDKMSAGECKNLERAYETLLPLLSAMGDAQAADVLTFGEEYMQYFPEGRARTEVQNFINKAKAAGVVTQADATATTEQSEGEQHE